MLMAGVWTSSQDSWGSALRHRLTIDARPRFYEFDSNPYLNSIGVGGIWTVSFIIVGMTNPSFIATVINTVAGSLHLTELFSDPKVIVGAAFTINSVVAYVIRVSIGRQFKSEGVDLPQEAIEAWQARKNSGEFLESDESEEHH